jgi:hypothetical protein
MSSAAPSSGGSVDGIQFRAIRDHGVNLLGVCLCTKAESGDILLVCGGGRGYQCTIQAGVGCVALVRVLFPVSNFN